MAELVRLADRVSVIVSRRPDSPPALTLEDGIVDLFDATVSEPPLKIRLEQLHATVGEVMAPTLVGRSPFDMTALVKGVQRDGRVHVSGWAEVATRDSSVRMVLQSVDLVALQPYLVRATETRIQKGTLGLELDSEVRKHHLRAPGRVVISDLEFAPARGAWDTFMGLPRGAVVNSLKNKGNKIEVDFVLEGDARALKHRVRQPRRQGRPSGSFSAADESPRLP